MDWEMRGRMRIREKCVWTEDSSPRRPSFPDFAFTGRRSDGVRTLIVWEKRFECITTRHGLRTFTKRWIVGKDYEDALGFSPGRFFVGNDGTEEISSSNFG